MNIETSSPTNITTKLNNAARTGRQERQAKSIHASGYFNCILMQWYGLQGTPKTDESWEPEWEFAAEVGNAIHDIVQKRLELAKIALMIPKYDNSTKELFPAVEVPLDSVWLPSDVAEEVRRYRIGGRIDAIVNTANGPAIFEIKTAGANALDPKWFGEKLVHYGAQVQLYMHFFRYNGQRIEKAYIYVINSSNYKDVRMYTMPYDPKFVEGEIERINNLVWALFENVKPEAEPERRSCKFCGWKKLCEKG